MTTYVFRHGKLVEKAKADYPVGGSAPYVISDTMESTWHPASGKRFSSKSGFRQHTRDMGCREVGNDVAVRPTRKWEAPNREKRVRDIQRAIHQLQQR